MRVRWRLIVVTLVVAALRLISAQTVPQGAGTGLIAGKVVDAITGGGVAGAVASLRGSGLANGARSDVEVRSVIADADGRFVFRNVPQGTFSLEVMASGYPQGAFGRKRPNGEAQSIELADGAHLTNVTISLFKHAAISGTILDELGLPMAEVRVQARRRSLVAGRYRLVGAGSQALTDDRGVYRISTLQPGDYVIVVPSVQTTIPTSVLDAYQAEQSVAPVFGPGPPRVSMAEDLSRSNAPSLMGNYVRVGDLQLQTAGYSGRFPIAPQPSGSGGIFVYPAASSAAITIGAGEERQGIDLQLRPVLSFRVSGVAMGPDGPAANMTLRLVAATAMAGGAAGSELTAGTGTDAAVTVADSTGAFTFLGVPSGPYTISVRRTGPVARSGRNAAPDPFPTDLSLWADQTVSVADADVRDVRVLLRPAARVLGRLEFDGAAPKPSPDRLRSIPVMIERVDNSADFGERPGNVDVNGRFDTAGFAPGKYLVRIGGAPSGWALKSAILDGRDVSETPLDIEGSDITGVVITFTDRPIEVRGTVRDADGLPDASAGVVMFPVDRSGWMDYGLNPRRIRLVRPDARGAFALANYPSAPAGEYFIAAVKDEQLTNWRDPDFLEKLSHVATRVTLSDGDRKTLDLKTSEVR